MAFLKDRRRRSNLILGLIVFVGWIAVVILPQWGAVVAMRPQIEAARQQLVDAQRKVSQLPKMRQQQTSVRELLRTQPRATARERLPALLDELAELAKTHGVTAESVRPAEQPRSASTDSAPAAAPAIMLVEIVGQGGYHDIGRFLDAIEQSDRMFRLGMLRIEPSTKDPRASQYRMIVKSYVAVTE